jgi:hypothetical protein
VGQKLKPRRAFILSVFALTTVPVYLVVIVLAGSQTQP